MSQMIMEIHHCMLQPEKATELYVARKLIKACRLDLKNKDGSTPVELADKINILKLSSCYELQNVNNQIL